MIKVDNYIKDIEEIVRCGDLDTLTSKKIRKILEEKHDEDLTDIKRELDIAIMKVIDRQDRNSSSSSSSSDSDDDDDAAASGRKKGSNSAVASTHTPKSMEPKPMVFSSGSDLDEPEEMNSYVKSTSKVKSKMTDEDIALKLQDEEKYGTRRMTRGGGAKPVKKAVKRKSTADKKDGAPKKKTAYTKQCVLSEGLAAIMEADKMPRNEVVKRMWQIVKDRNLYDPKNRQFMLCDEQLQVVFGRKRVKIFGMMKYLSSHIWDEDKVNVEE